MANQSTRLLLITANIASCFEQHEEMFESWMKELMRRIEESDPKFIALHCQEVGGKNYESSFENVNTFFRKMEARMETAKFSKFKAFLDLDYNCAEKFTALGNLYFVHDDLSDIQIWNFEEKKFVDFSENENHIGDIEEVPTKEKSKFPQEFFPACKWSRKGFMRTRWSINGTQIDLVNIHLFHDASNLVAMEKYPSDYTLNRKRAFEHTLDRFHNDGLPNVPTFIFGDFNFRLDTGSVVKEITKNTSETVENEGKGNIIRKYFDSTGSEKLVIGKKVFRAANQKALFIEDRGKKMRTFDKEIHQFDERICEFGITFPPSYPFEEAPHTSSAKTYMQTRCPSWCDRIVFTKNAHHIIDQESHKVLYDIIGMDTRMGDHKPVSLCLTLRNHLGQMPCCSSTIPCKNFVHDPEAPCFEVTDWCVCATYQQSPSEHSLKHSILPAHNANLKRARSDPMKFRTLAKVQHSLVVMSHSVGSDGGQLKLKHKHSSSRLVSHHSSSSEEWFEEVLPLAKEDDNDESLNQRDHNRMTSCCVLC